MVHNWFTLSGIHGFVGAKHSQAGLTVGNVKPRMLRPYTHLVLRESVNLSPCENEPSRGNQAHFSQRAQSTQRKKRQGVFLAPFAPWREN